MTVSAEPHRNGRVQSGEVELAYRAFGAASELPPILILHGANYYDSADWIEVGTALSVDREVVALDARGFGESGWSPSKDYSTSAQLADIAALCRHFDWQRPVVLGHSRGGLLALRYVSAARIPVAALILVDWCPRETTAAVAVAQPAPARELFPDLAAALAATSRDPTSLERAPALARLRQLFEPVPGGYALTARDPMYRSGWSMFDTDAVALWQALHDVAAPTLVIRATRSTSVGEAAMRRIGEQLPRVQLVDVDAGHDVAQMAPTELVAAVRRFILGLDHRGQA